MNFSNYSFAFLHHTKENDNKLNDTCLIPLKLYLRSPNNFQVIIDALFFCVFAPYKRERQ